MWFYGEEDTPGWRSWQRRPAPRVLGNRGGPPRLGQAGACDSRREAVWLVEATARRASWYCPPRQRSHPPPRRALAAAHLRGDLPVRRPPAQVFVRDEVAHHGGIDPALHQAICGHRHHRAAVAPMAPVSQQGHTHDLLSRRPIVTIAADRTLQAHRHLTPTDPTQQRTLGPTARTRRQVEHPELLRRFLDALPQGHENHHVARAPTRRLAAETAASSGPGRSPSFSSNQRQRPGFRQGDDSHSEQYPPVLRHRIRSPTTAAGTD